MKTQTLILKILTFERFFRLKQDFVQGNCIHGQIGAQDVQAYILTLIIPYYIGKWLNQSTLD